MAWYVSRQNYASLGEDASVVEICGAAKTQYEAYEYANPGQLVGKYDGEGEDYKDPREAVKAAIVVANAWKADGGKDITIRHGFTGGNTIPFDEPENVEDMGAAETVKWADELFEKLPKCTVCGEIMGKDVYYPNHAYKDDAFQCCSEHCAEKASEPEDVPEDDENDDDGPTCNVVEVSDGSFVCVDLKNRAAAEQHIEDRIRAGQYDKGQLTITENG